MRKIYFIFLFLASFPYAGFAQGTGGNQNVYTLSPLLSVTPKVYVINESDLPKYQLPQNYMIVKNPSKNKVTLWAFPNEFPANQAKEAPKPEPAEKSDKAGQEKPKPEDAQKPPLGPAQLSELLKSAGLGAGKELSIQDIGKLLQGVK